MKRITIVAILFIAFTSFLSLNAQWARTYGTREREFGRSIQQTSDGGYIVAGDNETLVDVDGGMVGGGFHDVWVLKLSTNGDIKPECGFFIGTLDLTVKDTNIILQDTDFTRRCGRGGKLLKTGKRDHITRKTNYSLVYK